MADYQTTKTVLAAGVAVGGLAGALWAGAPPAAALAALLAGITAYALMPIPERVPLPVEPPPERETPAETGANLLGAFEEPLLVVRDRRVLLANRAAKALLGAHIEGSDVRLAIRHPAAAELLAGDEAEATRIELVGLGDLGRPWEMVVAPLADGSRLVRLADLSQARAAEQMRVDFVANASHELRTPLATLLGFLETLQESEEAVDAETRARFVRIMFGEATRMRDLLDDLMSLSRIEADRFTIPRESIALLPLIEEVIAALKPMAKGRPIGIENETGSDEIAAIGDYGQLAQMLNNLIVNALKYGRAESPVRIRLAAAAPDLVRLDVIDQGEGIAADHIPRLTERFYRVDPGRSRQVGGTGLGLAIVKHIVLSAPRPARDREHAGRGHDSQRHPPRRRRADARPVIKESLGGRSKSGVGARRGCGGRLIGQGSRLGRILLTLLAAALALIGVRAGPAPADPHRRLLDRLSVHHAVAERFAQNQPSFNAPIVESTGTGAGMQAVLRRRRRAASRTSRTPRAGSRRASSSAAEPTASPDHRDPGRDRRPGADRIGDTADRLQPHRSRHLCRRSPPIRSAGRRRRADLARRQSGAARRADPGLRPAADLGHPRQLRRADPDKGCESDPAMKALKESDTDRHTRICTQIREDGAYIEAGENDNLLVQKRLRRIQGTIGVLGYSLPRGESDRVQRRPDRRRSRRPRRRSTNFTYPGARQLYIYVKGEHLDAIPGLREFVAEYARGWGRAAISTERGLIPLPDAAARGSVGRRSRGPLPPLAGRTGAASRGCRLTAIALLAARARLRRLAGRRAARAVRLRRRRTSRGRIRCPPITAGMSRCGRCCRRLLFLAFWASISHSLVLDAVLASPAGGGAPARSDMQRAAILAEARALADRRDRRRASTREAYALAPVYRAAPTRFYAWLGLARRSADRLRRRRLRLQPRSRPHFRARTRVERMVMAVLLHRLADRDPDHARHRPLAAVRDRCASSPWSRRSNSCSALNWSPQTAIRADQAGSSGAFGAMPLFWGTIFIGAIIAMIVAIPLGLMSAIYLTQYARPRCARWMKPIARDPRRRADRGLRLFRRADRGAGDPRPRPCARHPLPRPKARSPPASSWG